MVIVVVVVAFTVAVAVTVVVVVVVVVVVAAAAIAVPVAAAAAAAGCRHLLTVNGHVMTDLRAQVQDFRGLGHGPGPWHPRPASQFKPRPSFLHAGVIPTPWRPGERAGFRAWGLGLKV